MSVNKPAILKRRVRRDFTVLPNDLIRDRRLSWKAVGLLSYILSLPDDFRLYLDYLSKQKKDGRHSTRAGLKELELAGYLTIRRERGELGKYTKVIWEVTDSPVDMITDQNSPRSGNLKEDNPKEDNPNSENPTLINTNSSKELNVKNTTTTNPEDGKQVVVDLNRLIWPHFLLGVDVHTSALQILQECPEAERQNVLHEIAGKADKGEVRSPLGLLHTLVDRAKRGQFTPAAALEYQRKLENEAKTTQSRIKEQKRLQEDRSPQAKEAAIEHLSELRKRLKA